jgi:predicted nucleic acid-binding protein
MSPALLDTDTISDVLKQRDKAVIRHAIRYERLIGTLRFSAVTRYEIT